MATAAVRPQKVVWQIPATVNTTEQVKKEYRQLRVAAYCRVSTQQEEQLNSYSVQVKHYTELINNEPKWTLVGIYADGSNPQDRTAKRRCAEDAETPHRHGIERSRNRG